MLRSSRAVVTHQASSVIGHNRSRGTTTLPQHTINAATVTSGLTKVETSTFELHHSLGIRLLLRQTLIKLDQFFFLSMEGNASGLLHSAPVARALSVAVLPSHRIPAVSPRACGI